MRRRKRNCACARLHDRTVEKLSASAVPTRRKPRRVGQPPNDKGCAFSAHPCPSRYSTHSRVSINGGRHVLAEPEIRESLINLHPKIRTVCPLAHSKYGEYSLTNLYKQPYIRASNRFDSCEGHRFSGESRWPSFLLSPHLLPTPLFLPGSDFERI